MTPSEELAKLETMYGAWLDAGCPQTYSINGRMMQRPDFEKMTKRIDALRLSVNRSTNGIFLAGQFRRPE